MSSPKRTSSLLMAALLSAGMLTATAFARARAEPAPTRQQAEQAAKGPGLQEAQRAIADHGYSAQRLLTLGRAQLAQAELGPAIVSFERGLLLAPRDAALRQALAAARTRAGLPEPAPSRLTLVADRLSLREWSYLALGSSALFALSLVAVGWVRRRRNVPVAGLAVSGLLLALSGGGAFIAHRQLDTAYVLHEGSVLRQSPFAAAAAREQLRPGEAVQPRDQHADFVYVESERGSAGWIRAQELATLATTQGNPG